MKACSQNSPMSRTPVRKLLGNADTVHETRLTNYEVEGAAGHDVQYKMGLGQRGDGVGCRGQMLVFMPVAPNLSRKGRWR